METETTLYYRFPDGSVAMRTITGGDGTALPPLGATEITEEEYRAAYADLVERHRQQREEQEREEQERSQADYFALRAVGVPEETARRLTGYTGPDDPEAS